MIDGLLISSPTRADLESAYKVFEKSISDAFEKEGLGHLKEDILGEIAHKKHLLNISLDSSQADIYFLIAKRDETVIGTISFGPCGEAIRECSNNLLKDAGELGSLYVLPFYQEQGVGSALIKAMLAQLYKQGIVQFCLDSGYKRAQNKWVKKFGEPYKVVKDYWGLGIDHMIWLCNVNDENGTLTREKAL